MKAMFTRGGFPTFLFCSALLLFNWPLLKVLNEEAFRFLFLYLFGVWALLIALVFLVQRIGAAETGAGGPVTRRGEADV